MCACGGGVKVCACEGRGGGERMCAEGRRHEYILARCMGLARVNSTALVHGTQTTHDEQQCLSARVAARA